MNNILIVLLMSYVCVAKELVDVSIDEVTVVDPSQETPNSSVEGAWQARERNKEIECDLIPPVNVNMMEGSGLADDGSANETTTDASDNEEFPLATRTLDADDVSSSEVSDNSSHSTNLEASWNDIHGISVYFHSLEVLIMCFLFSFLLLFSLT